MPEIAIDAQTSKGETMTQDQVANQLTSQLMQSGNVAQNNFITVAKAQDYDYLEGKRIVTLDEAVGIREVQSAANPGGPVPRS